MANGNQHTTFLFLIGVRKLDFELHLSRILFMYGVWTFLVVLRTQPAFEHLIGTLIISLRMRSFGLLSLSLPS